LNLVIRSLFRLLGWILGRVFARDIADEMRVLRGRQDGDWFEITMHSADISILDARRFRQQVRDGTPFDRGQVDDLVARLAVLQLDQETWDAVRRLLYRLDRDNDRFQNDRHTSQAAGIA
jgi:hypothetical protein